MKTLFHRLLNLIASPIAIVTVYHYKEGRL